MYLFLIQNISLLTTNEKICLLADTIVVHNTRPNVTSSVQVTLIFKSCKPFYNRPHLPNQPACDFHVFSFLKSATEP